MVKQSEILKSLQLNLRQISPPCRQVIGGLVRTGAYRHVDVLGLLKAHFEGSLQDEDGLLGVAYDALSSQARYQLHRYSMTLQEPSSDLVEFLTAAGWLYFNEDLGVGMHPYLQDFIYNRAYWMTPEFRTSGE